MSDAKKFTTTRNVGRQLTYTDDVPQALINHFDIDIDEVLRHNMTTADKSNFRIIPSKLPSIVNFCRSIGINQSTLHRWMSDESQLTGEQRAILRNAYQHARGLYENMLAVIGMTTNGSFIPFMLKCNFGWRDNTEVKSSEQAPTVRLKIVTERPATVQAEPGESVEWGDD